MVTEVTLQVDSKGAKALLDNIEFKRPKESDKLLLDIAKRHQRNLRLQLTKNGTLWRKKTWNSIKAKRISGKKSVVTMSKQGIYLDSMKDHFVKLKVGRLIHKWALQKGSAAVKKIAKRQGSIKVRAHPFREQAFTRTLLKINDIIKMRVENVFK